MRIRQAHERDHPAIGDLSLAAYEALEGFSVSDGYRTELLDVPRRARGGMVLVAEVEGSIRGTVTFVPGADAPGAEFDDPEGCGIRMLAVDPGAQGSGIGRELTHACMAEAARLGRRRVILHTTASMPAARSIYESLGFQRAPELDWQPEPEVALLGYVFHRDRGTEPG